MKRIFADLHLCPKLNGADQVLRMISKASSLGYHLVAVTFPASFTEEGFRRMRSMCEEAKIDLVSRIDLKPRTSRELTYSLRRVRRRFEVVAVMCESKDLARQAARDRRVDLLNFPSFDLRRRFFDYAEAELASKTLSSLEIDVKPLLTLEGPARIRLLSGLRRESSIAKEFHVPIVISSGVSSELFLRRPRELASLARLFDLDEASAIEAVSDNPVAVVRRNREKLSSRFVAPGIRIIRGGRDC